MNETTLSSAQKIKSYQENACQNGLPTDAYLQVTEQCNCRCAMCDIWKNPGGKSGEKETLVSIIQTLREKNFNWVTLWGGEPYLHPDIIPLMAEVKKCGMRLQLITNGTLLRNDKSGSKLDATVELADNVVFSLDGATPEIHDAIRGIQGTFARTIRNLTALLALKKKTGKGPEVEIDTTILLQNIAEISAMIDFSKQFGDILVDFDPAQIQGTGNSADQSIIEIPEAIVEQAFGQLITAKRMGANITSEEKLELMKDYLKKKPVHGACFSLFKDLLIAPDGKVYFCWGWDKVIGNILDTNFKEEWEGAIRQNLEAIDGKMGRCKSCGFSHVRWPDKDFLELVTAINTQRKKYFMV
ncbi:MAG: hypothetical protein UT55_C0069G0009 [Candidatus Peregrinibacteria bacterium GW2011_GWE2_39_6]|nr:MAG: hypothetical protein UT36_C0008G0056 [Candidatus Peregrinibacteria bacterium GW2011_GWF2_39_17]KKR24193.1 MAG: hypothetical protein UT55_C0069G0009 [Candidatus Peregrinibacteria bacterium GW2011_GWE2_39_6]HCW32096.1 hypothetical protein [Candidatus Peregrinibacteria bacterium]